MFLSCTEQVTVIPRPSIEVQASIDESGKGQLTGRIDGAYPHHYKLAIYIKATDGWHNLPNMQFPLTDIKNDARWACDIGGFAKDNSFEFRIFLVPSDYTPPLLNGSMNIPIKMNILASAKKVIVF